MVIAFNPQSIGQFFGPLKKSSTNSGFEHCTSALSKPRMRCTNTLWSDLGPGFRTQRRLRDPAEDGHHLEKTMKFGWNLGGIPGEQLFPDRIPLRPISESKDQRGGCNPHSILSRLNSHLAICAQATLPKKKSKACWIQEENPLNQSAF